MKLKYLADINRRVLPESTDPDFEFVYIDISAVSGGGSVQIPSDVTKFQNAPSRARRIAPVGSTVVSTVRTYLRAIAQVPPSDLPLVFSTGFAVLEAGSDLDGRFLGYACLSQPFIDDVVARSVGVSYPAINPSELANIEIPCPSLEEQRRIADFLDAETARVDALLANRRRQIVLLNERQIARILDALAGRAEPGRRKDSGLRWLGLIPSDWAVAPVSAHYEVLLGKMLNPDRLSGDHLRPYLRNTNVQWDRVDVGDLLHMDFPPSERARYEVLPGDLLVCEGGEPGRAAFWNGEIQEIYYQKALHRVRRRTNSELRWLFYCLRAASAMNAFAVEGNQTTIAHLTGEQLRVQRFPFPEVRRQREIVSELDNAGKHNKDLVVLLEHQQRLLEERRQALITAAVTGQFDVTTARGADLS